MNCYCCCQQNFLSELSLNVCDHVVGVELMYELLNLPLKLTFSRTRVESILLQKDSFLLDILMHALLTLGIIILHVNIVYE